jgi:alanine dehydrogenase
MQKLKLGIIKEGKNPPDKRVPLTPEQCFSIQEAYGEALELQVQESDVRIFPDTDYLDKGIQVVSDVSQSEVLIGVKEVPIADLIPDKTYLFFSHTIKEQPYNRDLMLAVLKKNIRLIDWEVLTDAKSRRLIGFGRYAGIVGAYNGLRAYGLRTEKYSLEKASDLFDRKAMEEQLKRLDLDNIKILLTGRGRVAKGAMETLKAAGIKKVSPEAYLSDSFNEPVYTQIGVEHYNKRKDGKPSGQFDFYKNFAEYESDFMKWAGVTDFFIAGHFYAEGSPFLFTREDAKHADFKIRTVADISCDIDGPVASTIRPSTIEAPIYGYNRMKEIESDSINGEEVITVMAVDNLPCELPRDASKDFGEEFIKHILPAFMNGDTDGILSRATMTLNGKLTSNFSYLRGYVDG